MKCQLPSWWSGRLIIVLQPARVGGAKGLSESHSQDRARDRDHQNLLRLLAQHPLVVGVPNPQLSSVYIPTLELHINIYIYIYIYIILYTYNCACICIYIYLSLSHSLVIYIYMYVCMYVYVCMYACMYVCICQPPSSISVCKTSKLMCSSSLYSRPPRMFPPFSSAQSTYLSPRGMSIFIASLMRESKKVPELKGSIPHHTWSMDWGPSPWDCG